jgi:glutamate-ammonia-ligase adenylyltransferase
MIAEPALQEAPDRLWQQWLDWAATQGRARPAAPVFDAIRTRVWEGSEYVAQAAARHPAEFADLLDCGDLDRVYQPSDLASRLAGALAGVTDEPALQRALRRFRRREQTRIIWRDLGGLAGLDETLEDLSELADCCIREALARLHDWTRAELGTPVDPANPADVAGGPAREQHLLVIGMGKLGARELNLSSDIDLIFAFPAQGQVSGGPRELTNQQFFLRLAQRLVQTLDNQTVDGFVFRVDTRLRPFGDAGPLVMALDALEDYYQSQAREWERYAMIKARVLTGDPPAVAALENLLRPFVYRNGPEGLPQPPSHTFQLRELTGLCSGTSLVTLHRYLEPPHQPAHLRLL